MGPAFRHGCRLEVTTRDGRRFHHERLARRGSPEDAVGEAEIERKFDANVGSVLSVEAAARLRDAVMRLDSLGDAGELVSRLSVAA
jgi:hypothetical protein